MAMLTVINVSYTNVKRRNENEHKRKYMKQADTCGSNVVNQVIQIFTRFFHVK